MPETSLISSIIRAFHQSSSCSWDRLVLFVSGDRGDWNIAGTMMAPRLILQTILITSALTLAHPDNPPKPGFNWNEIKHVIAFGDSYTYVQGTHGLQNYSFIGDYLDIGFSGAELLTNQIVQNQTSTASGGPNWLEYLTNCGLKPGLTSPLTCKKQLWNFAFAGADISLEYVKATLSTTTTDDGNILSPLLSLRDTLVVIWIGINDILDTSSWTNVSFPSLYNNLLTTEFAAVEQIYQAGYRNFLFMNLPPLDKTPGNVAKGAEKARPNETMVGSWNDLLVGYVDAFTSSHRHSNTNTSSTSPTHQKADDPTEITTILINTHKYLNQILARPSDYGIKNSTSYCPAYDQRGVETHPGAFGCLPLEEYFWFNAGHLSGRVHEVLAGMVGRVLLGGFRGCGRGDF
ncbi:hypothetical protein BDV97DRAFT_393066 [Delphinella strobiligena]|nr:hypothetical protein BDV97DRAFT_393066 [Delphinella strobiligena]